jgi:hypothetical protein
MMKVLLSLLLLLAGVTAKADTFHFAFTGQNFNASGTITGELISPGVYQVTAISGVLSPWYADWGDTFVLTSPREINDADNLLYANEPFVDSFGINFAVADGSYFSLAHDNLGYQILGCFQGSCTASQYIHNRGDLVVSSTVPEPASLLLASTGILALGSRLRRFRSE